MVQGRHLAREQIRQLVERGDCDTEAKTLRRRRHGGDGEQRIVGRRLQSFAQGLVGTVAIDVENAKGVGDEEAIELPALERLGELDPEGQLLVAVRLAVRVPPQARGRMGHSGTFEAVETDAAIARHSNSQRAVRRAEPAQPVSMGRFSIGRPFMQRAVINERVRPPDQRQRERGRRRRDAAAAIMITF